MRARAFLREAGPSFPAFSGPLKFAGAKCRTSLRFFRLEDRKLGQIVRGLRRVRRLPGEDLHFLLEPCPLGDQRPDFLGELKARRNRRAIRGPSGAIDI
jgi:hypothetical protein